MYQVLSIPLRRCSRTTIFINTDYKESRDSLLLPFTQLQKLDDDDENIYCKNIIDRYAARPQHLEDISLAEFAANYTYKRESTNVMWNMMKMTGQKQATQNYVLRM